MTKKSSSSEDTIKNKKTKKRYKKPKPTFNEFLLNLRNATSMQVKKDTLSTVFQALNRGFEEPFEYRHVDFIAQELFTWQNFSRIALKLSFKVITGRSSPFINKLIVPLRQEAAKRTGYPLEKLPLTSNVYNPDRKQILKDWIFKKSINEFKDEEWARNAIVCIISENFNDDDFGLTQLLIDKCARKRQIGTKKKKKMTKDQDVDNFKPYLKYVESIFSVKNFPMPKALIGVEISKLLNDKIKKMTYERNAAEQAYEDEQEKSLALKTKCDQLNEDLNNEISKIESQKDKIAQYEQSLSDEKNRYRMLDETLKRKGEQKIRGLIFSLQKYFSHELQEAKLALDRSNPNTEMALSRIFHMEEYLQNIKDN